MREKPVICRALVGELVKGQFPQWADLPVTPVPQNGWDNRTFRLGDEMSIRLPSAKRYVGQVRKEQRWLPRLAPLVPLPIPVPLAMGAPTHGYPWHWSIYRWIDGENAEVGTIEDPCRFAASLAHFLVALQAIRPAAGPLPGAHNFFRGGPLSTYDSETREAIASLSGVIHPGPARTVWETALQAEWNGTPVWIHGDMCAANLLIKQGGLSAVIDFGSSGVGDPACDLTIGWTLFSGHSRDVFYESFPADEAMWARARGWALWKALITLVEHLQGDPVQARAAHGVLDEILADHASHT